MENLTTILPDMDCMRKYKGPKDKMQVILTRKNSDK